MKRDRCRIPWCRASPTIEVGRNVFGGPGLYCEIHNEERLEAALYAALSFAIAHEASDPEPRSVLDVDDGRGND